LKTLLPALSVLVVCAACNALRSQSEEYRWFESGWYVGGTGGTAITDASASDLDKRLASQGFTTSSTLDDQGSAWKAFLGYRFERFLGFELGFVNLGTVTSRVDTMLVDPDVLVNALADTQPFLGKGPSVAGLVYLLDTRRVHAGIRGGGWYWQADVEARTTSGDRVKIDEESFDPFFGVFTLLDVNDRSQLRFEYERYYLDGDGADFLSVGMQIRFD